MIEFKYINSRSEGINFFGEKLQAYNGNIHSRKWSVNSKHKRIGSSVNFFERDFIQYDLTLCLRGTLQERYEMLDTIHDIFEYDVNAKQSGKLYFGSMYIDCYIIESETTINDKNNARTDVQLTLFCPNAQWIKETISQFVKQEETKPHIIDVETDFDKVQYLNNITNVSVFDAKILGDTTKFEGSINLLDYSKLRNGDYNGTAQTIRMSVDLSNRIYVKSGETYTISQKSTKPLRLYLVVTNSSNALIQQNLVNQNVVSATLSVQSDGYLTPIFANMGDTAISVQNIIDAQVQIEKGSTASEYVPYYPPRIESVGTPIFCDKVVVFDGSSDEGWTMEYGVGMFSIPPISIDIGARAETVMLGIECSYNSVYSGIYAGLSDNQFAVQPVDAKWRFHIKKMKFQTVSEWTNYLSNNPLTVYYQSTLYTSPQFFAERITSGNSFDSSQCVLGKSWADDNYINRARYKNLPSDKQYTIKINNPNNSVIGIGVFKMATNNTQAKTSVDVLDTLTFGLESDVSFYRILFVLRDSTKTITKADIDSLQVQLNEGTQVNQYAPYHKYGELILPYGLNYFNDFFMVKHTYRKGYHYQSMEMLNRGGTLYSYRERKLCKYVIVSNSPIAFTDTLEIRRTLWDDSIDVKHIQVSCVAGVNKNVGYIDFEYSDQNTYIYTLNGGYYDSLELYQVWEGDSKGGPDVLEMDTEIECDKVVDLGTLNWSRLTTAQGKYRYTTTDIKDIKKPTSTSLGFNGYSNKYLQTSADRVYQSYEGMSVHPNGNMIIYDSEIQGTAEEFKAKMNGVMLYYQSTSYDGSVKQRVSKVTRRWGRTSLKDLNFYTFTTSADYGNYCFVALPNAYYYGSETSLCTNKFFDTDFDSRTSNTDKLRAYMQLVNTTVMMVMRCPKSENSNYSSQSAFENAFKNSDTEVVYKLVTPQIYCYPPQNMKALGSDVVYTDGPSKIKYSYIEDSTEMLDYSYDFPFDYTNSNTNEFIDNDSFKDSEFRIIVYGHCSNPTIYIGDNCYRVNVDLAENEYLTIDSMTKKIFVTDNDGHITNVFNKRARKSDVGNDIFELIPSGRHTVSWNQTFKFDIIVIQTRSEPKWI